MHQKQIKRAPILSDAEEPPRVKLWMRWTVFFLPITHFSIRYSRVFNNNPIPN